MLINDHQERDTEPTVWNMLLTLNPKMPPYLPYQITKDAGSDLVVTPFPRRSEIQDQLTWVLRVGNGCNDGPE